MQSTTPPPLRQSRSQKLSLAIKCLIAIACIPASLYVALIMLRLFGLIRPFYIPTGSMAPALSPGDHIVEEGITLLRRNPRPGDIVVFKSDDNPPLTPGTFYLKRVVGLPGNHVELSGGELFIDGKQVSLSNREGKIIYDMPSYAGDLLLETNLTVPKDYYFLLGDNSTNSFDSRFFGGVPRKDIKGLAVFCYWPPARIGVVR